MKKKSLKIALVGYGRMGHIIHAIAERRGHQVVLIVDTPTATEWNSPLWSEVDVAIEFTTPATAYDTCLRLIDMGVSVVSGTTGWADGVERLKSYVQVSAKPLSFLWASNFSIGVNLFLEINRRVATLMEHIQSYTVSMEETHHIHKLDAPSGTAITVAENVISYMPSRLDSWALDVGEEISDRTLSIKAYREGEVPGIHSVCYQSAVDRITLSHEAFGRDGFAEGAVVAAEYTSGKSGVYTMDDLLTYFLEKQ